jgi:hypothetical protein
VCFGFFGFFGLIPFALAFSDIHDTWLHTDERGFNIWLDTCT